MTPPGAGVRWTAKCAGCGKTFATTALVKKRCEDCRAPAPPPPPPAPAVRSAPRRGRTHGNFVWTDDAMLTALHLMDDGGKTALEVGKIMGVPRSAVLGIRHRVKVDLAKAEAGISDAWKHDGTMGWAWVRAGLDMPGRPPL